MDEIGWTRFLIFETDQELRSLAEKVQKEQAKSWLLFFFSMGIEPTHVGYNGERDVMGIEYDMYLDVSGKGGFNPQTAF